MSQVVTVVPENNPRQRPQYFLSDRRFGKLLPHQSQQHLAVVIVFTLASLLTKGIQIYIEDMNNSSF